MKSKPTKEEIDSYFINNGSKLKGMMNKIPGVYSMKLTNDMINELYIWLLDNVREDKRLEQSIAYWVTTFWYNKSKLSELKSIVKSPSVVRSYDFKDYEFSNMIEEEYDYEADEQYYNNLEEFNDRLDRLDPAYYYLYDIIFNKGIVSSVELGKFLKTSRYGAQLVRDKLFEKLEIDLNTYEIMKIIK